MHDLRVAILGSNSHIAKGLINNFLRKSPYAIYLFTRSAARTGDFLKSAGIASGNCIIEEGYRNFMSGQYDVVINCVGAGTPNKLSGKFSDWFTITEEFDNLTLGYLQKNPGTLYVNFSSGAVYGKNGSAPVEENTENRIRVNHVPPEDYYSIVRLNSESKHRSFDGLKIADLRIFAYFSRFIDLSSGYFITELVNCLLNKKTFMTNDVNIVRDYIHPDDLYALVLKCIQAGKINTAFDAISAKPVDKCQTLDFFTSRYGLKYEVNGNLTLGSPNGAKNIYCSNYNRAAGIGYKPEFSSMDALEQEAKYILVNN